jgi:hypothetical protein
MRRELEVSRRKGKVCAKGEGREKRDEMGLSGDSETKEGPLGRIFPDKKSTTCAST